MPYTYTLISLIPATAQDIYETWLDSLGHSEMTGSDAIMSDEVGAEVSAWDGYITGRNLELVPGERIVQSWRTTKFTDEHGDSVITVTLEDVDEGALLTLVHSNVPDEQRNYEEGGWESNYFEPMRRYFLSLDAEHEEAEPAPAAEPIPEPVVEAPPMPTMKPQAPRPKAKAKPPSAPKQKAEGKPTAEAKPAKAAKAKPKAARPSRRAVAKASPKPKAKAKAKTKTTAKTKATRGKAAARKPARARAAKAGIGRRARRKVR